MAEPDSLGTIKATIAAGISFVLDAGAGSGKTRCLIETIRHVLDGNRGTFDQSNQRIACITFTNVAKDEINSRLNDDPRAFVGTIHEFLWEIVHPYQSEIKEEVISLNAAGKKDPIPELPEALAEMNITYGQYGRHFERGELSHDDVITIAFALFSKHVKMSRIASDLFPFILVDEYQDTSQHVINLLLRYFVNSPAKPIVGFFGDSMQQIYGTSPVDFGEYENLVVITKLDNYRCSRAVVEVLNRLRPSLQQKCAAENLPGSVALFTSGESAPVSYAKVMANRIEHGWSHANTKVLVLTHRGIAREIGYEGLLKAYGSLSFGNDRLMKRDDEFGEFFSLVESLAEAFARQRYGEFLDLLGKSGFQLRRHEEKQDISYYMAGLQSLRVDGTVRDVVAYVDSSDWIVKPRKLTRFLSQLTDQNLLDNPELKVKRDFAGAVMDVPYREVVSFAKYVNENTPFSTKHGVKGAEFENVLVIVDDSLWSMYKFAGVFTGQDSSPDRLERSRKLLYVCFSRAKDGLAVLCLSPLSGHELDGAVALLGVEATQI